MCVDSCRDAGLTPVGRFFHRFPGADGAADPAGVSGGGVLAESHLAIQTGPATASVSLDLYVCNFSGDNRQRARQVFAALTARLRPQQPVCREVGRGSVSLAGGGSPPAAGTSRN